MNEILEKLFKFKKEKDKNPFTCMEYEHTAEYKKYMSDPVEAEKKILLKRGLDAYNVGHSTRSAEITCFVDKEYRDAQSQLLEHLKKYKCIFNDQLINLEERKSEAKQLRSDVEVLKRHIVNLESFLEEDKK